MGLAYRHYHVGPPNALLQATFQQPLSNVGTHHAMDTTRHQPPHGRFLAKRILCSGGAVHLSGVNAHHATCKLTRRFDVNERKQISSRHNLKQTTKLLLMPVWIE